MKQDTVAPQDQADHELGLEIIRVLGLKRNRENGRVETTHGNKNPCGLTRTLRRLSTVPETESLLEALQMLVNICTHPNATKAQMQQIAQESRAATQP